MALLYIPCGGCDPYTLVCGPLTLVGVTLSPCLVGVTLSPCLVGVTLCLTLVGVTQIYPVVCVPPLPWQV